MHFLPFYNWLNAFYNHFHSFWRLFLWFYNYFYELFKHFLMLSHIFCILQLCLCFFLDFKIVLMHFLSISLHFKDIFLDLTIVFMHFLTFLVDVFHFSSVFMCSLVYFLRSWVSVLLAIKTSCTSIYLPLWLRHSKTFCRKHFSSVCVVGGTVRTNVI